MSEFTGWGRTNEVDFGDYVEYPNGRDYDMHICKVVGAFRSNVFQDTPDWAHSKQTRQDEVVSVLNIIHCGIDETKVIRVRQSDCVKVEYDMGGEQNDY